MERVNLAEKFDKFHDYWSPKILAEFNNSHVKIAKFKGAFVWHHHANEDELFLAGCGKTYFFIKNPSAPCDETGFLPLVLLLWGRLQRGKAGCGRPFSAAC